MNGRAAAEDKVAARNEIQHDGEFRFSFSSHQPERKGKMHGCNSQIKRTVLFLAEKTNSPYGENINTFRASVVSATVNSSKGAVFSGLCSQWVVKNLESAKLSSGTLMKRSVVSMIPLSY